MVTTQDVSEQKSGPARGDVLEIASVLLVVQGSLWLMAGLSALPFGIVERFMGPLGAATLLLATATFFLAWGITRRRRWARTGSMILEALCLLGALILALLPIGALAGPVPVAVNLVLPAIVFLALQRSPELRGLSTTDAS